MNPRLMGGYKMLLAVMGYLAIPAYFFQMWKQAVVAYFCASCQTIEQLAAAGNLATTTIAFAGFMTLLGLANEISLDEDKSQSSEKESKPSEEES